MNTHSRLAKAITFVLFVLCTWIMEVSPTFAQSPDDFPKVAVELRGGLATPSINFTGYDKTGHPAPLARWA